MIGFWMWLVVGVVLIPLGLFVFSQGGSSLGPAIMVIGVVILLALVMIATIGIAHAHDHNHPERNDWLKSLHAKNTTWCCDGNDTDAIEDWETKGQGYRVKFRGQWFDVPEGAIVDGPNQTGEALLWMNKGFTGFSVRCFMPGTMS